MSLFKRASRDEIVRYPLDETGEDYIEFRTSLSKKEVNSVIKYAPTENRDVEGGVAFLEHWFNLVKHDWSWVDEDGNKVPMTLEAYREMDMTVARVIDEKLQELFSTVFGKTTEDLEGKV